MMKKLKIVIIGIIIIASILILYLKNDKGIVDNQEIVKVSEYNNPIVPEGFRKVETAEASWEKDANGNIKGWNDGLVIEDENENQFVWIPIKNKEFSVLKKEENFLQDKESQEELEQIDKYGGFYIGRYEAGLPKSLSNNESYSKNTNDIEGIPIIKKMLDLGIILV